MTWNIMKMSSYEMKKKHSCQNKRKQILNLMEIIGPKSFESINNFL